MLGCRPVNHDTPSGACLIVHYCLRAGAGRLSRFTYLSVVVALAALAWVSLVCGTWVIGIMVRRGLFGERCYTLPLCVDLAPGRAARYSLYVS